MVKKRTKPAPLAHEYWPGKECCTVTVAVTLFYIIYMYAHILRIHTQNTKTNMQPSYTVYTRT